MQDETYVRMGELAGAEVGLQQALQKQTILVQYGDVGQRLASLLALGGAETVRLEDTLYWRIPHNHDVDGMLIDLIDLFISIRYAHPTLVQLELVLPAARETEVIESDEPVLWPARPTHRSIPSSHRKPLLHDAGEILDSLTRRVKLGRINLTLHRGQPSQALIGP
jgi:hypothetical protein